MDDILIFCDGSIKDVEELFMTIFFKATCMILNKQKSTLTPINMEALDLQRYAALFSFKLSYLDDRIKYLGFILKPNNYIKEDWNWILEKLEKRINIWSHHWISRAGRLVLVK